MTLEQHSAGCRLGLLALALCAGLAGGCNAIMNGFLDPTAVGNFNRETTLEIRTSLSIQDTPTGIPGASDPQPEDLVPHSDEYHVTAGDVLSVRVFELLARNTETATQATVDEIGTIVLPVLGQIRVAGMTRSQITEEIQTLLRERGFIEEATVIVELAVRRGQTYTVFGATSAPNLYPIPRPDTRLLEALNTAGGFFDTVTDIYVIRKGQTDTTTPQDVSSAWRQEVSRPGYRTAASSMTDGMTATRTRPAEWASTTAPNDDPRHSNELLEAAAPAGQKVPPASAPAAAGTNGAQPAVEGAAPPAPGSRRWVFVNGAWVETEDAAPEAPPAETAPPGAAQPPVEGPPVGTTPEAVAQVDWDRLAGEQEQRIIHIDAQALRDGDPRQNIVIRNGDAIRVIAGQVGEYYVMGQVARPGAFSITGREITLKAAVAAAGNLAPLGWPDRCTIYRRYGDREEMHQVDLDKIFAGTQQDLMLKNNDLIVVGTHPAAPFLAVLRNAFRMTYGFGFVYDRNFADIDSYGSKLNPSLEQDTSPFENIFR
jgi:protein involved in polysaccharide export with SLBB domain